MGSTLAAFLVNQLDTASRLTVGDFTGSIDLYRQAPNAYVHVLQTNEELHKRVSAEVRTAFGVDLIINWVSGQQVGFNLGEEPPRDAQQDKVSASIR